MSNFAFGTSKITDFNQNHLQILRYGVESGITTVVTSSNYTSGSSETAVGMMLESLQGSRAEDIEVISKYNLKQNLSEQLKLSCSRIGREAIDGYLIENPQELFYEAIKNGISLDDRLDAINSKFYDAFLELELAVQSGKITYYGVSSDAFSINHKSQYFLPYEDLVSLADEAAQEVGNSQHSLNIIELPINMLEREGLKCASWARQNNIRVLAKRPLNAKYGERFYRLADYDEPYEYYYYLNELLELSENDTLMGLYNLILELDENKHKYSWIGDYEVFLYSEIIPYMKKSLEVLDDENTDTILGIIDMFLQEYKKMIKYECSLKTRAELKEVFLGCSESMQQCAFDFLLQQEDIDMVVVSMTKQSYIDEISQK